MPLHLKRCDEPGHVHFWTVSCHGRLSFFWLDEMKHVVVDGLRHIQQEHGICLVGYVVMPEHVHVLLYPHARGSDNPLSISTLLRDFKQFVGFHGKARLREYWKTNGSLWSDPLNKWARAPNTDKSLWLKRGYDFNVTTLDTLVEKLNYCHKNPITRGLVDRPEDWAWSSFRYYEQLEGVVLNLDWDGGWPVIW